MPGAIKKRAWLIGNFPLPAFELRAWLHATTIVREQKQMYPVINRRDTNDARIFSRRRERRKKVYVFLTRGHFFAEQNSGRIKGYVLPRNRDNKIADGKD